MILAVAVIVSVAAQVALTSTRVWWVLAACRPTLLVLVGASRSLKPVTVGWIGLAVGLLLDALADRLLGPGAIAAAIGGVVVATVITRFELKGPLFWLSGSVLVTAVSESVWFLVVWSLGLHSDHGAMGLLATVATTSALALLLALGEVAYASWRSPERRRRRTLKRL